LPPFPLIYLPTLSCEVSVQSHSKPFFLPFLTTVRDRDFDGVGLFLTLVFFGLFPVRQVEGSTPSTPLLEIFPPLPNNEGPVFGIYLPPPLCFWSDRTILFLPKWPRSKARPRSIGSCIFFFLRPGPARGSAPNRTTTPFPHSSPPPKDLPPLRSPVQTHPPKTGSPFPSPSFGACLTIHSVLSFFWGGLLSNSFLPLFPVFCLGLFGRRGMGLFPLFFFVQTNFILQYGGFVLRDFLSFPEIGAVSDPPFFSLSFFRAHPSIGRPFSFIFFPSGANPTSVFQ